MTYRINKILSALFVLGVALGLSGCGTTGPINVLGGCPIPAQYDVHKDGPKDLVVVDPQGHAQEEATQRHEHKQLADDFNAFHDYVATKCK